jgi:hypothetical protein
MKKRKVNIIKVEKEATILIIAKIKEKLFMPF